MERASQWPCPGCGVSISPAQRVCAFCERRQKARNASLKRRWILGSVAGGLLLGGLMVAGGSVFWPKVVERMTPVLPEPAKPRPLRVEVTHDSVSVDGEKLWELPPFSDQGRLGAKPNSEKDEIRKLLSAALERASVARPHEPGVVEVDFAADTPALVVSDLWPKLEGHSSRLSVKASSLGPATTVHSPLDSSSYRYVLDVEVRTHGVDIHRRGLNGEYYKSVSSNCELGGPGGLAVMLRRPADYATLKRCFQKPRAEVPAGQSAHPSVSALKTVPAARLFHVVNLLRCGELQCSADEPRSWDMTSIGAVDEYGHAPLEAIPILMIRLEPELKRCWETVRASLPEPSYEAELRFDVDHDASLDVSIGPGLPQALNTCVERVVEQAKVELPLARPITRYIVPLPFGT